jgi:hypothetical protein
MIYYLVKSQLWPVNDETRKSARISPQKIRQPFGGLCSRSARLRPRRCDGNFSRSPHNDRKKSEQLYGRCGGRRVQRSKSRTERRSSHVTHRIPHSLAAWLASETQTIGLQGSLPTRQIPFPVRTGLDDRSDAPAAS